jgi:hypothetical protein
MVSQSSLCVTNDSGAGCNRRALSDTVIYLSPAIRRWYRPPLRLDPPEHALGHLVDARHTSNSPVAPVVSLALHDRNHAGAGDTWREHPNAKVLRRCAT